MLCFTRGMQEITRLLIDSDLRLLILIQMVLFSSVQQSMTTESLSGLFAFCLS